MMGKSGRAMALGKYVSTRLRWCARMRAEIHRRTGTALAGGFQREVREEVHGHACVQSGSTWRCSGAQIWGLQRLP
jgi:hypothetical protein